MDQFFEHIKENMYQRDNSLSQYACKSKDAILIFNSSKEDIRPSFFKDIDRIIHSYAYTRYIDKTQVFSFIHNDHITHRVLHVQLVSKIARTIGRALNLNEDLIEAISLAHDVGHTPFGHTGEAFLNEICQKENIGYFCHNAQSVRLLKDIEYVKLSLQTFDGILAHNGEILLNEYSPKRNKTLADLEYELEKTFHSENFSKEILPMTLEGCVVRVSDVISYIGRDVEDAITVGTIKRNDLPKELIKTLGDTNSKIVNTLINDLIKNSYNKPYITFSKPIFNALNELKDWNYKHIYSSNDACRHRDLLKQLFNDLFYFYLEKFEHIDLSKKIEIAENTPYYDRVLFDYINNKKDSYKKTPIQRIIIDYIAGQTDSYFLTECKIRNLIPENFIF